MKLLNVYFSGKKQALSRSRLNRNLKTLTGQSANEFIRYLRLKRPAQLLEHPSDNI